MTTTTKQVIAKVTNDLLQKASLTGQPDLMAMNKFAQSVLDAFTKQFRGDMAVLDGLVAMAYAAAHFAAVGVVQTVTTREDLQKQIVMINDVLTTTVRMALDSAWTQAHEPQKHGEKLLVTVPGSVKA